VYNLGEKCSFTVAQAVLGHLKCGEFLSREELFGDKLQRNANMFFSADTANKQAQLILHVWK